MALSTCLCKSVIGFLNVVIMLIGLAIAVIGVILQVAAGSTIFKFFEDSIKQILGSIGILSENNFTGNITFQALFEPASVVLIVVGLFIACVAFLGCCGASCNYRIILILYTIVLGILLLAQIIIVILFFANALDNEIKKQAKTIEEDFVAIDDSTPASVIWNVIMIRFQCCGLDDFTDFNNATKWRRERNLTVNSVTHEYTLATPIACCLSTATFPEVAFTDDLCAVYPNNMTNNFATGCWAEVTTFLAPHRTPAIVVISAIFVIEAAVLLVTIIIIKSEESTICPT